MTPRERIGIMWMILGTNWMSAPMRWHALAGAGPVPKLEGISAEVIGMAAIYLGCWLLYNPKRPTPGG